MKVKLENGAIVECSVIERMGYNHDIGAQTAWVKHETKEFMAVRQNGFWRKWGATDRVTPLIEHLIRKVKERHKPC